MPKWLNTFFSPPPQPPWTDNLPPSPESLSISMDKENTDSIPMIQTSMTSTAFDLPLPPPAVHSTSGSSRNRNGRRKAARFNTLSVYWANFRKRIGTGTAPSSSSVVGESTAEFYPSRKVDVEQTDQVDEIVVDRAWTEDIKSSVSHSEHGANPEKSGGSNQKEVNSDHESVVYGGIWNTSTPLGLLRWRAWPFVMEIFSSRFIDEKSEVHYAQVYIFYIMQISTSNNSHRRVGSSKSPLLSQHRSG